MIERNTRVLVNMANPEGSALIELLNSLGGEVICTYPIGLIESSGYLVAYDQTHLDAIQKATNKGSDSNETVPLAMLSLNKMLDMPNDGRYFHIALPDEVTPA